MINEFRRLFVDSRFRTAASQSNSNLSVELPFSLNCPAGSQLFVDNIVLSHSWPTITTSNNKVFIEEVESNIRYHRMIEIEPGHYTIGTIATELQSKLRTGTFMLGGVYNVTFNNGCLTVSTTSPSGVAYIYGREDILGNSSFFIDWTWGGTTVEFSSDFDTIWRAATVVSPPEAPHPRNDACEMLGIMGTGVSVQLNAPATLNYIDLQKHKCLYLCSGDLGESTSMTMRGSTDVIRKIPVGHTTQGQVIVDTQSNSVAFALFRSDTILKFLSFQIRDYKGDLVHFYDHDISFEICISRPTDR